MATIISIILFLQILSLDMIDSQSKYRLDPINRMEIIEQLIITIGKGDSKHIDIFNKYFHLDSGAINLDEQSYHLLLELYVKGVLEEHAHNDLKSMSIKEKRVLANGYSFKMISEAYQHNGIEDFMILPYVQAKEKGLLDSYNLNERYTQDCYVVLYEYDNKKTETFVLFSKNKIRSISVLFFESSPHINFI